MNVEDEIPVTGTQERTPTPNENNKNEVEVNEPTSKEDKDPNRVIVTLMNTPGVPSLKTKNRAVDKTMTFRELTRKVHKILKLEKDQTLFLYVNNAFSPILDTTIENVINCFAPGENKLTIHYSINHAFG
uniref:Ubiquitin-like protein ATG12 n=1 Tax=Parastrongyloides trichosuri TaxID=131310 RepID=A0A0N4ZKG4_PARTI